MTRDHLRSKASVLRAAFAAAITAAAIASSACQKQAAAAPPVPEVVVTAVVAQDVPIYSEWVGTTDGFVNAQVRPRVQGYLLEQSYHDGRSVRAGDLLFQIDDR